MFLTAEGGILGPFSKLFGYLMNGIYILLEKVGLPNIGLAIIIFTLITRILLHPTTVNQQKSSRIMALIQPEIKVIQKKYEGRQDQASMMQQQAEIKAVYEKYGTSMTGNCLPLLIQMPIIFALYRVIMNVPAYVPKIKEHFTNIVDAIGGTNAINTLIDFAKNNEKTIKGTNLNMLHNFGLDDPAKYNVEAQKNLIIDFLYKLNPSQINELATKFPDAQAVINSEVDFISKANMFCGLDLSTAPSANGIISPYIVVPILAGLSQYFSVVIMQNAQKNKMVNTEDDAMAQSMKSMNIMMPLMSVFFCFSFATGIGIYWIASSVFMLISQLIVNAQLKNLDIDDMIAKNIEKQNKKRAKKGLQPLTVQKVTENIKHMEATFEKNERERENLINSQKQHIEEAGNFYFENEDPNSLFAKANMVKKYNEKHS